MHTKSFGRPTNWTVSRTRIGQGKGVAMKLSDNMPTVPAAGISKGN
jgi:hypothetical protein